MKKSYYEIDGNVYIFNNAELKQAIKRKNPKRGAYEKFYQKIASCNAGISYEAAKGWVNKSTNPSLDNVKIIAEVLGINFMDLLTCTHYDVNEVHTMIDKFSKILFTEILDPFSFRYDHFSNVLDMIIGTGYNQTTHTRKNSDFAERMIQLMYLNYSSEFNLPELLGYKFKYSRDELTKIPANGFEDAVKNGYVDSEGNSFFDENYKATIDRKTFCKRLLENVTDLENADYMELQAIIKEAQEWWDYCDMPYNMLKIDIKFQGRQVKTYTYGPGWVNPTHEDRWSLILDILCLIDFRLCLVGLTQVDEMYIDQFESDVFFSFELGKQ